MQASLLIIETHPVQYRAPIYRFLQKEYGIPVYVIYGSDFSVAGYNDAEFKADFAWDTDLLAGYEASFLSKVSEGGAKELSRVSAKGLGQILKKIGAKTILLTGYGLSFHQQAFIQALKLNCKILFRGETADHAKKRNFVRSLLRDTFLRFFYSRCSKLLYIGKKAYLHYRRLGCPEEKLVFSPYCVDDSSFKSSEQDRERLRSQTRLSLGFTDSQIVLLFSGKLIPKKNPLLIFEALERVPSVLRNKRALLFMGDGELREALQTASKNFPNLKVVFLGFQNQSALSPYYHAADLLVLPSKHLETWGLVVNEALQHGLPCVVSDQAGCAPDLIEVNLSGVVFESGSAEAFASAIQNAVPLIGDKAVRDHCRRKAEEYSLAKAAEGIAKAYRAVC